MPDNTKQHKALRIKWEKQLARDGLAALPIQDSETRKFTSKYCPDTEAYYDACRNWTWNGCRADRQEVWGLWAMGSTMADIAKALGLNLLTVKDIVRLEESEMKGRISE